MQHMVILKVNINYKLNSIFKNNITGRDRKLCKFGIVIYRRYFFNLGEESQNDNL